MGLNLILRPSSTEQFGRTFVSFAEMMVNRDGWAHNVRDNCPLYEYPTQDELAGNYLRYDESPFMFAYAEDLLKVENRDEDGNIRVNGRQTSGALAYLRELKPKTPVIVQFC